MAFWKGKYVADNSFIAGFIDSYERESKERDEILKKTNKSDNDYRALGYLERDLAGLEDEIDFYFKGNYNY